MRVLILGGGGSIGQTLASALQTGGKLRGEPVSGLCIADRQDAATPDGPAPCRALSLDLANRPAIDALLALGWDVIFHLDEVESGEAEADFAAGMRTNFFGTFNLFDAVRASGTSPVLIHASSFAVFSDPSPADPDSGRLRPGTSYGAQKAIGELLLSDYTRRGAVDGRSLRLPSLLVDRAENGRCAAAFASTMVRETLAGRPALCPVGEEAVLWVASAASIVDNLLLAANLDGSGPDRHDAVSLPGLAVRVGDLLTEIDNIGGEEARDLIDIDTDPATEALLAALPAEIDTSHAAELGMRRDESLATILRAYLDQLK